MFFRFNLPTFVWALFIFILSALPGSDVHTFLFWGIIPFDKVVHIGLFTVLIFLMKVGFVKQYSYVQLRYYPAQASLAVCILYGVFLETMQGFVFIGREFDVFDLMANIIGCVFGLIIFNFVYREI